MPIYEYLCVECNKKTEAIVRHDDPPPSACPECGGKLEKLLSAPSFQFKGSGWYVTDYARKDGGDPDKTESKGDGEKTTSKESEGKSSDDGTKKASEDKKTKETAPSQSK